MLDKNMLAMFLDSLENNGNQISTSNLRLRTIRAFLSYAAEADPATMIHKANASMVPEKNLTEPGTLKFMSEKAIAAILKEPSPLTKKGLRDPS